MLTWTQIGLAAALAALVGGALDYFCTFRQRSSIYERMVRWWVWLDDLAFRDLHTGMAQWTLNAAHRVFRWRLVSWQTLMLLVLASLGLTTLGYSIGRAVEVWSHDVHIYGTLPLALPTTYLVNFIFDAATLIATGYFLKIVATRGPARGFDAILLDVLVAVVLAMSCAVFITWSANAAFNHGLPGTTAVRNQEELRVIASNSSTVETTTRPDGSLVYSISVASAPVFAPPPSDSLSEYSARLAKRRVGSTLGPVERDPEVIVEVFIKNNLRDLLATEPRALLHKLRTGHAYSSYCVMQRVYREDNIIIPGAAGVTASIYYTWPRALLAATTLIPTLGYLAILLLMLTGKLILEAARRLGMHFLEAATEHDPGAYPHAFKPGLGLGLAVFATLVLVKLVGLALAGIVALSQAALALL